jgi:DNA-directed RNA polymerase subunit K
MAPTKAAAASGDGYTRFERARIVGARALQIALGAPVLLDVPEVADTNIDPVRIAHAEQEAGIIPITVVRETKAKKAKRPVRVARITEVEGVAGAAADIDIEPTPSGGEEELQ